MTSFVKYDYFYAIWNLCWFAITKNNFLKIKNIILIYF